MKKKSKNTPEVITKKLTETYRELEPSELRWVCPTDIFKFKSTAEVETLDEIVGQPRAIESIKVGAKVSAKGFNIFVTGLAGTGRLSTVKAILEQVEGYSNTFYDYCYVNNFNDPDKPALIKLPQGEGKKLAKAMEDAVNYLRKRLPKLFDEDDYQNARRKIFESYQQKENEIISKFDETIRPFNLIRGNYENEQGIVVQDVFPVIDGQPVHISQIEQLVVENKITKKQAKEFYKNYQKFHAEIFNLSRHSFKMLQEMKLNLAELDKTTSLVVIDTTFKEIEEVFDNDKIKNYIKAAKEYILNNLSLFIKSSENTATNNDPNLTENDIFSVFSVNVILDNSETKSPPIIIETTPSYTNLFGTIEKTYDKRGFWKTDFSKIKAGALLRADQGYLIVNADDLFVEPGVWQALKRVLLYNKLEIQPVDVYFQISQSYIKPEPIDINVKIIVIGGQTLYHLLYEYEKGFKKIFKINAQFDYYSKNNEKLIQNYIKFISRICSEENLPHLTPDGVARIVEWSAEYAGSQEKLTLKFSDLADLVREASYYSNNSDKLINREAIQKALEIRRYRNNMLDEKIKNEILDDVIMVSTSGERIGQINGLTIYNDGIYSFGKPARITSTVSVGNSGIINIEREAQMSGAIHNKAILIISGFLRERFAQKFPLSLSATIAFEQSYGGIDGDSASLAEIYVLLSGIAKCPINQSFAITGSMNQKGDAQPIGGVNEKIRGFWDICKSRGFTGNQGCIIPEQNVKDLMLDNDIIQDVQSGNFKIYSVKRVEDAVPLLFGMEAGEMDNEGNYPEGTLFAKVVSSLQRLYKLSRPQKQEQTNKNHSSAKAN